MELQETPLRRARRRGDAPLSSEQAVQTMRRISQSKVAHGKNFNPINCGPRMKQSMDSERAIALLTRQKDAIGDVAKLRYDNEAGFTRWRRDTSVAIEKSFGSDSRHLSDFDAVRYSLMAFTSDTGDHEFQGAYVRGLQRMDAILSSMIQELQEFSPDLGERSSASDALSTLELICRRFHAVTRQLRLRRSGRPTLNVEDEYDAQDLLHALLRLHFDDIRLEEWTPSYAGGAARMDFCSRKSRS